VEAVLAGCAEQVEPQVTRQRDAAEVHGNGRRRARVVDADAVLGHRRLGRERLDVGDGADEGRLADREATGDNNLDGDRRNGSRVSQRRLRRLRRLCRRDVRARKCH
jgi:hypothetical protein